MLDNLITRFHDVKTKRENGDGGFTLIELLVVVVIIGILIAIAIPLYLNYQKGAKDKSAQSDLRAAVATVNQCYTDNSNAYPAAGDVTGSGTANADLVFTCGSTQETAKASDGTTLTYTPITGGYKLSAFNSGGNRGSGNPYTYDSTAGGKVG